MSAPAALRRPETARRLAGLPAPTRASRPATNGSTLRPRRDGVASVVIADQQHLVRAGVTHSLARASAPQFEVVAEAGDMQAMLGAVARHRPDLLIIDVVLLERCALEALAHAASLSPGLAVVVLSACAEPALVRAALSRGALGYVLKDAQPGELVLAVTLALRGASYLAPGLAGQLAHGAEPGQSRSLTVRELEVVKLIALGHTFPEIAGMLHFSERTVKNDRASAAATLGVSSRVELTRWALEHGLLDAA